MTNFSKRDFETLAQSYGADFNRWPEKHRDLAAGFETRFPQEAARILQDAAEIDQYLGATGIQEMQSGDNSLLMARILQQAAQMPQDGIPANDHNLFSADRFTPNWKALAATLAASLTLGFGAGQLASADTGYDAADALLSISYSDTIDDYDWMEPAP